VADAERGCAVPVSSIRGPTYVPSTVPGSACGTLAQPWIVDAEPGQHLDVSVTDFDADDADRSRPCPGYLIDGDEADVSHRRRNVSLCPDGRRRQRDVYRSVGHVIELITSGGDQAAASEEQPAAFLVRFDGTPISVMFGRATETEGHFKNNFWNCLGLFSLSLSPSD